MLIFEKKKNTQFLTILLIYEKIRYFERGRPFFAKKTSLYFIWGTNGSNY